jgi:hypothetical protein
MNFFGGNSANALALICVTAIAIAVLFVTRQANLPEAVAVGILGWMSNGSRVSSSVPVTTDEGKQGIVTTTAKG